MKYLVTGAAGFIGSSITDALLSRGQEVTGIDCFVDYYPRELKLRNLDSARSSSKFSFIEENLLEADLPEILEGVDVVFHQAAQAGVRASWGATFSVYTENNIRATQRLLETVKAQPERERVKRIVYASSSSIYGTAETLPTTELTLPAPVSPYGVTKLAAEHLMVLYAKEFGIPTASLRYFTVYGPRQRPDMFFNRIIRAALMNREMDLFGDGEQSRDFTFIDDIVQANLLAGETKTPSFVFNVGGGARVTVNEVIVMLEGIMGQKIKIRRLARAVGDARHTGADTSLMQRELKFRPQIPLREGLKREVEWLEQSLRHPNGYPASPELTDLLQK